MSDGKSVQRSADLVILFAALSLLSATRLHERPAFLAGLAVGVLVALGIVLLMKRSRSRET